MSLNETNFNRRYVSFGIEQFTLIETNKSRYDRNEVSVIFIPADADHIETGDLGRSIGNAMTLCWLSQALLFWGAAQQEHMQLRSLFFIDLYWEPL